MKRNIILILLCLVIALLFGCSKSVDEEKAKDEKGGEKVTQAKNNIGSKK